jgi:hypothetical protein
MNITQQTSMKSRPAFEKGRQKMSSLPWGEEN